MRYHGADLKAHMRADMRSGMKADLKFERAIKMINYGLKGQILVLGGQI